jgi:hypothetical protein
MEHQPSIPPSTAGQMTDEMRNRLPAPHHPTIHEALLSGEDQPAIRPRK